MTFILGSASIWNFFIPPSILCTLHSEENKFKVLKGKICFIKAFLFPPKDEHSFHSALSIFVLQCRNLVLKTTTRSTSGIDFVEDVSISDIVH